MRGLIEAPSPSFDDRALPVSIIVIHYTGMPDGAAALARLRDPVAKVSAHYLIEEDGTPFRLVAEDRRAWHAGVSRWRGITDINSASIGIELVNPGHEFGYRPFPEAQMAALIELVGQLRGRHDVPRANVVGHSDIAPARKEDPGELFDWQRLASHRLALAVPTTGLVDPGWNDGAFLLALERFGYDIVDPAAAVRAFQRRFRPALLDGVVDGQCRAILWALLLERDEGRAR